ncbi:copper resistance protein CopC [Granulicella sp. WH15]|uniref:copper resistance CopC family protein n=1 Tax=Granulicella sp. WH15 TaxID=2602070 RepID=UPI001367014F|nr:copper resistance protein CopC [Granulicella sp. WH15]QHN03271.1 copper resistance protein CopC [Granulicella sp. WH15]
MMQRIRSAAVLTLLLSAIPAFAHSRPKEMSPDKNSTVSAPTQVSVVFTEPLEGKFSSLSLTDEKGAVLSKEHSVLDPADAKHMTLPLPTLAPGTYYVHWIAVAPDSHRMEGEYPFTVK